MNTTYRVNVALNGELGSINQKLGVTVPEIAVLIYVHGIGSVTEIAMYSKEDFDSDDERNRLSSIYGPEKVSAIYGTYGDLPTDIKQLKLDTNLFEKGAAPIGEGGAKKKKD